MDPNQPVSTSPMPSNEAVDPTQISGSIEFPPVAPAASPTPEPTPNPNYVTNQPTATEPYNPPNPLASNSINATSPIPDNTAALPTSTPLDPVAVDPIPPSSGLSKFKLPFPAIIIGLIVLVILIVVLSLTVTNSVKPITQTTNSGEVSQPPR